MRRLARKSRTQSAEPGQLGDDRSTIELVETLMNRLDDAEAPFAPTSFWRPAVAQLIDELGNKGIERFKSWTSAEQFFYPRYGQGFNMASLGSMAEHGVATNPRCTGPWVSSRLSGAVDAHRDLDIALAMLNRKYMDYDLLMHGESAVGSPPQQYRLSGPDGPRYGRPYLNYLKVLAALSTVIDRPVKRYVELGGGFGVLGELLVQHERNSSYVNIDIPPLIAVAYWYLNAIGAGDQVIGPVDGSLPAADDPRWTSGVIATLPSWRFPEFPAGVADVFVNSFSFQEMEPTTVAAYASLVSSIAPEYVVSLNSRGGKPLVSESREVGVEAPTTSAMIEDLFTDLGYTTIGRFGRPAAPPQAELIILRR